MGKFVARYGRPTIAVERSVLHGVLRGALDGNPVRTGAQVVSFDQDAKGVTVRVADGSTERGDLLIGADGIHSAVRGGLLGPEPPRYTGYIAWRGKARPDGELIPPGTFNALFGPGTRFTYYDVAPGVIHWMSVANGPAGGADGPGVLPMLMERHRGWTAPVREILAATDEDGVIRGDVLDRKPDRRWGTGRVTLLGDAAHPITFNIGQGACQALEDALVLADYLEPEMADPIAALRAYEAERRARTAPLQRTAWWIGRMGAVENRFAIRAREALMRLAQARFPYRRTRPDRLWNTVGATGRGQPVRVPGLIPITHAYPAEEANYEHRSSTGRLFLRHVRRHLVGRRLADEQSGVVPGAAVRVFRPIRGPLGRGSGSWTSAAPADSRPSSSPGAGRRSLVSTRHTG